MRIILLAALCVTCMAEPTRDVEVVVPPSAAHPQNWLRPRLRDNPNSSYHGKSAASLAEFVAPEVISKIVVDQYAGDPDDVRRYLTAMPTAAAQYFGPSLRLCKAGLAWTSTSAVTFESGRTGRLAVATVFVVRSGGRGLVSNESGPAPAPTCLGPDKVPYDSLYVNYLDPDGYSWYFAIPLQRKK